MDSRPIGVFDSGLGGLTAVRQLRRILPEEKIVYFGDTGRVPYGSRGRETITRYAAQGARLLLDHQVKVILSACGTVSSVAGELLEEACPCPYLEVVAPAVEAACHATRRGRIGVIATRATISSGKFQRLLQQKLPGAFLLAAPCPLFVPLVEEGHYQPGDPLVEDAMELYLSHFRQEQVDTLILGCTHYPLLAPAISAYMGDEVTLIDSGREAAEAVAALLREKELLAPAGQQGSCDCMVSDSAEGFSRLARIFLGETMEGHVSHVEPDVLESLRLTAGI